MVPTVDCVRHGEHTLLYIGISPKAPPRNGGGPSKQSLWDRIRYHYRGNAEGSTLRLTLGCLLAPELGLELRRVGSGKRLTFGTGETKLSAWMDAYAFVAWLPCPEPWKLEEQLLGSGISVPLNLDMNSSHTFHSKLAEIRRKAKEAARALPVLR